MWEFPASFIIRFWYNHGFLEVNDRPQWYVIKGGSREYIKKLVASFREKIHLNSGVRDVTKVSGGLKVTNIAGESEIYDRVIFACHSDEASRILVDQPHLVDTLKMIPYQRNVAVLHSDTSVLPKRSLAHAAWNYFLPSEASSLVTVHYHMNILQSLDTSQTFIVSLNPVQSIESGKIIRKIVYHHPIFTPTGMAAQKQLRRLSGKDGIYFAGAYMRYGFHEDGVLSALHACKKLEEGADAK